MSGRRKGKTANLVVPMSELYPIFFMKKKHYIRDKKRYLFVLLTKIGLATMAGQSSDMFGFYLTEASVLGSQVIGKASVESCTVSFTLKLTPFNAKTMWTREVWSNIVCLKLKNQEDSICSFLDNLLIKKKSKFLFN